MTNMDYEEKEESKIDGYKKARCPLFRQPIVDFSGIKETLEKTILDAWQSGSSAGDAASALFDNSQIIGALKNQVEESLAFQKQMEIERIERDSKDRLKEYQRQHEQELSQIKTTLSTEREKKEAEKSSIYQRADETQTKYNATQQRLEKLRREVREKAKQVGGEKNIDALIAIDSAIREDKPIAEVYSEVKEKSEEQKLEKTVQEIAEEEKKQGRARKAMKKFWKFMVTPSIPVFYWPIKKKDDKNEEEKNEPAQVSGISETQLEKNTNNISKEVLFSRKDLPFELDYAKEKAIPEFLEQVDSIVYPGLGKIGGPIRRERRTGVPAAHKEFETIIIEHPELWNEFVKIFTRHYHKFSEGVKK